MFYKLLYRDVPDQLDHSIIINFWGHFKTEIFILKCQQFLKRIYDQLVDQLDCQKFRHVAY